jgi:hypothetical protein
MGATRAHINDDPNTGEYTVALLITEPLGPIICGGHTADRYATYRYFSQQILIQVVQYLARLRQIEGLTPSSGSALMRGVGVRARGTSGSFTPSS